MRTEFEVQFSFYTAQIVNEETCHNNQAKNVPHTTFKELLHCNKAYRETKKKSLVFRDALVNVVIGYEVDDRSSNPVWGFVCMELDLHFFMFLAARN
jgi:hypothetical protein